MSCPKLSIPLQRKFSYRVYHITTRQLLLLDLELDDANEFPVIWMVGNFLELVWSSRIEKRQVRLYTIRADLEARASLLRETRHSTNLEIITEMLQTNFT